MAKVSSHLASNFSIESLLNTVEFDQLLTSIERDLDEKATMNADSKDSEEVSELGDVLAYLSKVAEEKAGKTTTRNDVFPQTQTSATGTETTLEPLPPPPHAAQKAPPKDRMQFPPSPGEKSSDSEVAPSQIPQEQRSRGSPQGRVNSAGRSGGGGRGGGRGGAEQQFLSKEHESDESNSDDDENWRKTRNRIKTTNEGYQEGPDTQPVPPSFWSAYGKPTTSLHSNIRNQKYEPKPIVSPLKTDESGLPLYRSSSLPLSSRRRQHRRFRRRGSLFSWRLSLSLEDLHSTTTINLSKYLCRS
jgi:hypothetical protein